MEKGFLPQGKFKNLKKNKTMKKLKKLFSPSALAATAAPAMLISSAVTALAGDDVSASTSNFAGGCTGNFQGYQQCSGIHQPDNVLKFWCCAPSQYCTSDVTLGGGTYYGWCSLTR